jgi:hypothetical protein
MARTRLHCARSKFLLRLINAAPADAGQSGISE